MVSMSTRAKLLRGFMVQDGCQMTSGDSAREALFPCDLHGVLSV